VWVGGRAVEGSGNIVAKRACCIASLTSASSVASSVLLLSSRSSMTMSVASFALAELVEAWGPEAAAVGRACRLSFCCRIFRHSLREWLARPFVLKELGAMGPVDAAMASLKWAMMDLLTRGRLEAATAAALGRASGFVYIISTTLPNVLIHIRRALSDTIINSHMSRFTSSLQPS